MSMERNSVGFSTGGLSQIHLMEHGFAGVSRKDLLLLQWRHYLPSSGGEVLRGRFITVFYFKLFFGKGTRLTVLEDGLNITQPSVVLFDPSPQELREKGKATLVCLATNFYPNHVTLRWSVNGKETTTGVKTDDSPTRGSDRMYSLSSRLRLTKEHWTNPHNTFKCSVYFDPERITISKETKGREEDGLHVTEPSVVLFDPSPQELREKGKATLVCLATNFYPDHVTLRWSVNGQETTTGVTADDSPTQGSDRMYCLSSRLQLTKKHWTNPQNTFKCSMYFDAKNIKISKETKGREGCCGVTPDSYRTSANTAKLTYVLLISKSALYGLFVTFLVWKLKNGREKNFI
ncbi:M1-specific T cell receptor beta chain-like isoform X2 [Ambystoma mexicanum]|uniref:M1-specific T cell receptor beta chain-like isoform X2 n=1 Tax=Ambystoma mexicanum TaxID=8296 RepID=UPI0037E91CFF